MRPPQRLVRGRAHIRPDQRGDSGRQEDRGAAGLGPEKRAQRRLEAPRPRGPSGKGGGAGLGVRHAGIHFTRSGGGPCGPRRSPLSRVNIDGPGRGFVEATHGGHRWLRDETSEDGGLALSAHGFMGQIRREVEPDLGQDPEEVGSVPGATSGKVIRETPRNRDLGGLKTAADRTDLRHALDEFLSTGKVNAPVRLEIAASWHRSMASALHPDRLEVPFASEPDTDDRLVRAARPVLDRLVDDLDFVSMSVVLSDQSGRVLDRLVSDRKLETQLDGVMFAPGFGFGEGQVGTNGIGTSLERGAPFMVTGSEHFVGQFTHMACAAAPIVDPTAGSVLGVVDLTCPVDSSHALMLAMAKRSAREIEARLVSGNPQADRVLLERFLRARRGSRGALVALNGQVMYTNAPAVRLMRGVDRAVLWDLVASTLFDQRRGLLH
ncbi:MAG: sigma-54 dependent transcriptional regulator, acetoin dehydrogenase operon transcriptional, partial [Actinomycetota bacterium]|nr:sigma-54 dependent transcriptional regulator, acetoin dehydrogenase operon transcriptional [Actinomycetota bacterium]